MVSVAINASMTKADAVIRAVERLHTADIKGLGISTINVLGKGI